MLSPGDVLELPPGVRLAGDALVDDVRCESFALNAAGQDVVLAGGLPLADAVDAFRRRWGLSHQQAERDVLAFAWVLNRVFLANVRRRRSRVRRAGEWLRLSARLLPLGIAPPVLNQRYDLDTSSCRRALVGAVGAVWRGCVVVTFVSLLASLPLLMIMRWSTVEIGTVVATATGLGVACHESGHALALRGIPAALVTSGLVVSVLHAPAGRRRAAVVGLLGPALPAAVAALATTVALHCESSLVAIAACPFAAHALTVTLAGRDGRSVCRS